MPQDPDALTDDELKAINDSGDASLMRQLSPEERRRLSALSYRPDPTMQAETARAIGRRQGLGGGWTRPPVVDELGRPLQSTEPGTYAGGFLKSLKDQIVGAVVGNPALEAAARPGASGTWLDTASDLSSLMLPTAPGALQGARQGARDVRATLSKPADVILDTLVKKTGIDPDAISLAATKKRLEMTRSRARQMRLRDEIATLEQQQRGMGGKPATPAETPLELTRRLRAENQARQTASGLDPRISGLSPGETPPPSVSGPQGVPASAVAPNASERAAVMTAANPRATPPEPTPAPAPRRLTTVPLSPQRLMNEIAIQARRQGVTLTTAEDAAAQALVREQGIAAQEAVQTVAAARQVPMTGEEQMIFDSLIKRGQSEAEARAAITQARQLRGTLGTPTGATMADRVDSRNASGRWPE